MIFDFLLSKKISKNLQHFLFGYFDNENIKINQENKKVLKVNLNQKFDLKTYKNFIEECDNFLLDIIKSNNLSLNDIYNKNLMKSDYNKYKGIYINGCSNLEKEIVQYYKLFTNNLPLSNTLLMCNEETTSEEIIAFLYRAIFCKKQICFCIAKPEELSKENKTLIKNLINEIFEGEIMLNIHQKMKASLFIMTKNLDDELCKSLFNFKFINLLLNIEGKNEQKIEDENIKIVHSDSSGVGKSTFIKAKAKNDYIYFPVGGVFSKEEILERFKELDEEKNINNMEDLLLHIDLYDTEQKSIMNDFLYFILVTKTIVKDINIFYLSRKIKIYLEIPKNFIDFFGKFSIITLIDEKFKIEIKLNDLPALIVPDNILSNERIVALYLKLLKEENILKEGVSPLLKAKNKIDKNEIVFEDINRDNILEGPEFDYNLIVIKAEDENKELTKDKCQKLIMEKLKECKIDNPNYYQINTFLKVLASQLVQFTRNKVLSICTLIDSKKLDSCKIRSYIIQKFIDITCYFAKGTFTELIKEQKDIQEEMQKKYEEKDKLQFANDILQNYKHEFISFDKLDLALVFFHGGDKCDIFSIITNKSPEDPQYKELLDLLNFQASEESKSKLFEKREKLTDYKSFKSKDFLKELKDILDLKNPLEKSEENQEKKSLEEIADDYVFTCDNFLKICLILMRIRANIPIIMMGETGCGKTSLIRKLSELQNNGDCLLVIHAGHTNKDIIKFIEEDVLPKSKELAMLEAERKKKYKHGTIFEEKKLLVFFDELNTCKSMDLLSEIICKHSYQGKILPENIVFIGAANPYRRSEQKKVGLKIKRKDNYQVSDLVYSVNPMPHSLLSYVFDFGSVSPKDEKSYIENMVSKKIYNNKLISFATELIIVAQNFVRKNNGIASVSLREIMRFREFYEFFWIILIKRRL